MMQWKSMANSFLHIFFPFSVQYIVFDEADKLFEDKFIGQAQRSLLICVFSFLILSLGLGGQNYCGPECREPENFIVFGND
jgi:hypothetical protein